MKKYLLPAFVIAGFSLVSQSSNAQYIDLSTGKSVVLVKHQANGYMYNAETQRPVYIYINPSTNDTFYGRTGANINGKLTTYNGRYTYNGDENYVYRNGDFQLKTEADFYRENGYKRKFQNDGDIKTKGSDTKIKEEPDGTLKVKQGADYRKKIDDQGNYKEKDSTFKVKAKVDGSVKVKDKGEDYKGKVDEKGDAKEKEKGTKRKLRREGKAKEKTEREKIQVTSGARN
jgi:hypothetical protein